MDHKTSTNYFDILQIFRGIAALMVVCHHTIGSIHFYHKIDYSFFNYLAIFGKYGVDFFFVLSGFIISFTAFYKYNSPDSFRSYVTNRLIRIYIPYLPIGILMYFLYTFLPDLSHSSRNFCGLTSFTLFPCCRPALSVAWTLSFELLFYLLFSISFFTKKGWNYFVILWCITLVAFNYSPLKSLQFLKIPSFQVLFSPYNFEFILGFLLSLIVIHKKKIPLGAILSLFLLTLFGFMLSIINEYNLFYFCANLLFSIMAFLLLYYFISFQNIAIKSNALFMMIGNATYSIYLIHNPLQMIFIRMYPKINSGLSLIFALLLSVTLSVLFGYLYFLVFEKLAIRKVKSIVTA